ncbi:SPFH domain-containing protein [Streptomyces sp. NPDC060035]|uniref:SPFH domain-containing protein n=1 Tax=Streptomyces sp. NPDC060035 TaxID=3347044 RepID=UPI0036CDA93D
MRSTENELAGEPVAGNEEPDAVPVTGQGVVVTGVVPGPGPGVVVPAVVPGPGPDDSPVRGSAWAEAAATGARDVPGEVAEDADGWGAADAEPVPVGVGAGVMPGQGGGEARESAVVPVAVADLTPVSGAEDPGAAVVPDPGAAAVVASPGEGGPMDQDLEPDPDPEPVAGVVIEVPTPPSRGAGASGTVPGVATPGEWDRMGDGGARLEWWDTAPVPAATGSEDLGAWSGAGRRHSVIANETTAPIPVHLLFRDDSHDSEPTSTGTGTVTGLGTGTGAGAGTDTDMGIAVQRPGVRRTSVPRPFQWREPTRPVPLADPRLAERPGPVLPGWAALFTGAAGTGAGLALLWWTGALPAAVTGRIGVGSRPYDGIGIGTWALLALLVAVVLFALCGIGRGRVGYASVLTLFGEYRGSVRRAGLIWVSPLLLRRRVDVRLRHWRSEPLRAVDASGTALRVVVLVVWRIKDTVRAAFGVADHEQYLRDQVEAALARVLSQLPADAFHEDTHTLRDAEAVGDALTRMLKADCEPAGIEVYSAQPTGIEYAPEVAAAMQRCRVAAIDAKHRDSVLTSVVDAVDDTVRRLTERGIVELDDYEHKALVRDLTVAFYTGRSGGERA